MDADSPRVIEFIQSNILLIGAILLVIFTYLVLLIKKRWRNNFLHMTADKKKKSD